MSESPRAGLQKLALTLTATRATASVGNPGDFPGAEKLPSSDSSPRETGEIPGKSLNLRKTLDARVGLRIRFAPTSVQPPRSGARLAVSVSQRAFGKTSAGIASRSFTIADI